MSWQRHRFGSMTTGTIDSIAHQMTPALCEPVNAALYLPEDRKIKCDQRRFRGRYAKPDTIKGEVMTQYLVAIHHPDDYDPSVEEDEAMSRDIGALNDEMVAAGVRIFVGGLYPASRRSHYGRSPMARCSSPTDRT